VSRWLWLVKWLLIPHCIETESEDEIERPFAALSDGGTQLMLLDDYGSSRRFGWVNDRYGVSWQLNLA
jgi:predicted 3-demethylubiquinone-9 3-methyltransferase (glyoxalase superfamily)